jgi:hypothetical protein
MPTSQATVTRDAGRALAAVWLGLGVLVVCGVLHHFTWLGPVDVRLRNADGSSSPVTFPYVADTRADAVLEFDFTIRKGPLTQPSVLILPDDHFLSLSVNGMEVPLTGISPEGLDDYRRGFRFPIGRYLEPGDNAVGARVLNRSGVGGLDVRADPHDGRNLLELLTAGAAVLTVVGGALRRLRFRWSTVGIWVSLLAVRLGYLTVTRFNVREHDVGGHLEYIEYIVKRGWLPRASEGYLTYHPPLYYVLAALQWKLLSLADVSRDAILRSLQAQSLAYELGFVVLSIGTAKLWLDRIPDDAFGTRLSSRAALTALLLVLLLVWPSTVIHSVRLGNDDLTYLLFAAGLYFASRWWLGSRDRDLYVAGLFAALGMVTKTNALLLFAVLGVVFVARLGIVERERRAMTYVTRAWPMAAFFVVSTGLALGGAIVDTLSGRRPSVLVGNAGGITNLLDVGNRAENYLWFDLGTFVTQAFTSPGDDAKGRQFFWNYALKTGLFGEFTFDHPALRNLAVVLSVAFLLLLVLVAIGFSLASTKEWLDELPLLAAAVLLTLGLVYLRMSMPKACSNDFRYILPVIAPFLYLVVKAVIVYRRRGWTRLARATSLVGWAFALLSATFFVVLAIAEY